MSSTPGLLWVCSKPKSAFSEADFNTWYTDHHIQHVVDSGLSDLAVRYKNVNPDAKWPYLAIYRLPDIARLRDEKIVSSIASTHELIPDGAAWSEAIEVDTRHFILVQKFEGQIPKVGPRGKAMRSILVEPSEGGEVEFDEWYRKQHLDMLSMLPGFRRTTRYELAPDSTALDNCRYLACHEFDTKDYPSDVIELILGTEWSKKIMESVKKVVPDVWEEIGCAGNINEKL
ncbi:hypothetical protein FKW77_006968 [Venturia effusa]|uniref:EthD domain-containing protein n=1 Tax=Venturia effusa TaxID=50376 RepID=A0A517LHG6_9PEZI|nr:hypothetical protein FKW77_006968 [Venturia effusa]